MPRIVLIKFHKGSMSTTFVRKKFSTTVGPINVYRIKVDVCYPEEAHTVISADFRYRRSKNLSAGSPGDIPDSSLI